MSLGTTVTGGGGSYEFTGLPAGDYRVRLPASNFNPGGVLRDYRSSTGPLPTTAYEPAPDADANLADSDDNGAETNGILGLGGFIQTAPITLTPAAEQSADATGGTTEHRVDFGVNNSPQIDLTVTKTDGQGSYTPGETLHYTIVVTNNGPADANGTLVHDDRPPQIASWTWTCAAGTPVSYNCSGDASNPAAFEDSVDLPQLASVTYEVTAQMAAVVSGELSNRVYVVPPAGMTDMTNPDNIATDVDALNAVDLAVTKSDGQGSYVAGGTVGYTIVITNNGPADANGMSVSDARPAQVTSWSWTCDAGTPAAYSCSSNGANPATFTDSLDLPASASVTYHVTAQIAEIVTGDLANTVEVTAPAGTPELNPSNNTATDVDTLAGTTLSITKTASPSPVPSGGILTYTIQVSNDGTANATMLTVHDALPPSVLYQSVSGDGWSCSEASAVVTCTRPLLAPGAAPPILITVRVTDISRSLANTATVTGANAEGASASVEPFATSDIPTLTGWSLAIFTMLLASVAMLAMRRV